MRNVGPCKYSGPCSASTSDSDLGIENKKSVFCHFGKTIFEVQKLWASRLWN